MERDARWQARRRRGVPLAVLGLICFLGGVGARAELPVARLTSIFPMGGRAGTKVEVSVAGQDLDEVGRLYFSRAGIVATPKVSAAGVAEAGKFVVTIDGAVPPGLYDLRAVGRFGVSNPRTFQVGTSRELVVKGGNTSTTAAVDLPAGAAVQVVAEANATQFFRVALKRGQPLFVEAMTGELDAKMEAVLVISDANGRELAHSRRGGRLAVRAPMEGEYFVGVHDLLYRGGAEFGYRLSAGGAPATQPSGTMRWPIPTAAAFLDEGWRGGVVLSAVGGSVRRIEPPCEIAGEFRVGGPRDRYEFEAASGAVYWIEVTCHRLGRPAAPFLLVQRVTRDEKGVEKATDVQEVYESPAAGAAEFAASSRDPVCRFEAKEAGAYRLLVRNLYQAPAGEGAMEYRLSVLKESPDFSLVVVPASPMPEPKDSRDVPVWSTLIRRGGVTPIMVIAARRHGFGGAIRLKVDGLPPGVTGGAAEMAPGMNVAKIMLAAAPDAAGWVGAIQVSGVATIGDKPVAHEARPGVVGGSSYDVPTKIVVVRSRLSEEFMVAVSGVEESALTVTPAATQPAWKTCVAGKVSIPLKLTRRGELAGPVTLKVAGHPALAPVPEFSVDPKADDANVNLDLVQGKLPPGEYTLYVEGQARVKYVNGKAAPRDVTASVYSTPFIVNVAAAPITLRAIAGPIALAVEGKVEAPIGIERMFGFGDPVVVHLAVPANAKGVSGADVTLAKDQTTGNLVIQADGTAVAGEYAVKMQAKLKLNGQDIQVEQDVLVKVMAGGK